jgi:hypothetical protein
MSVLKTFLLVLVNIMVSERKLFLHITCFPVSICICILQGNMESNENDCNDEKCGLEESRKEYNIGILKQVQAIFGHLAYSKLQYYVPRGLWKHFKLVQNSLL